MSKNLINDALDAQDTFELDDLEQHSEAVRIVQRIQRNEATEDDLTTWHDACANAGQIPDNVIHMRGVAVDLIVRFWNE